MRPWSGTPPMVRTPWHGGGSDEVAGEEHAVSAGQTLALWDDVRSTVSVEPGPGPRRGGAAVARVALHPSLDQHAVVARAMGLGVPVLPSGRLQLQPVAVGGPLARPLRWSISCKASPLSRIRAGVVETAPAADRAAHQGEPSLDIARPPRHGIDELGAWPTSRRGHERAERRAVR